jgi:SAM-dependent methyltransferase
MHDFYRDDLAYIHDTGFRNFALQAAPGILEILRGAGIKSGLILDLGCGSGLWAKELCDAGYEVLGIDLSASMLRMARQHEPRATYRRASFLQAKLPRAAAITAISECLNYRFDPSNGPEALRRFFVRVFEALEPGGLLIFDVAAPGRSGGPGKRQKNVQGDDWAILLETEEQAEPPALTRRITSFRRKGKLYRRSEEIHRLHLYRGAELAAVLRAIGFHVRLSRNYGKLEFPKGLVAVVARKPRAASD